MLFSILKHCLTYWASKQNQLTNKDLKTIRKIFKRNIVLTPMECSLLVSLPLFELRESEIQIVEEICTYLKKQNKLHSKKPAGIHHICHYLNILEYIEPKRQETLMEMIGLNDLKARGEFARLKQEAEKIGIEKTIPVLLDILTPEEISEKFDIELEKVLKIKNSNDK